MKADVAQRPNIGLRIFETHILESKTLGNGLGQGLGLRRRIYLRLNFKEIEIILQIERVLGNGREACQNSLQGTAQACKRTRQKGEVADTENPRNGTKNNEYISTIIAYIAQGIEKCAPSSSLHRELFVEVVVAHRKLGIALGQKVGEIENFYFFGRIIASSYEA